MKLSMSKNKNKCNLTLSKPEYICASLNMKLSNSKIVSAKDASCQRRVFHVNFKSFNCFILEKIWSF